MSADNGIYVLKLKDQYRVIHAAAIDNLWWDFTKMSGSSDSLVPTRLVEYFEESKKLFTKDDVDKEIERLSELVEWTEYGVCHMDCSPMVTWDALVSLAYEHAKTEIVVLNGLDEKWEDDLERLENFVREYENIDFT